MGSANVELLIVLEEKGPLGGVKHGGGLLGADEVFRCSLVSIRLAAALLGSWPSNWKKKKSTGSGGVHSQESCNTQGQDSRKRRNGTEGIKKKKRAYEPQGCVPQSEQTIKPTRQEAEHWAGGRKKECGNATQNRDTDVGDKISGKKRENEIINDRGCAWNGTDWV